MTMIPDVTTGQLFKAWRKKVGLTQEQMAERGGITRTHLSDYEADRYSPSVTTLLRFVAVIEKAYGQPLGPSEHRRLARFFRGPRGLKKAPAEDPQQ